MKVKSILKKGGKRRGVGGGGGGGGLKEGSGTDRTGKEREGEKNLQLKPWGCEATKTIMRLSDLDLFHLHHFES